MFLVSETDAAAIRAAFVQGGELSAAVELRRLFPCLADNENTRICARSIAGWQPLPVKLAPQRRARRAPR
jgi:ArsR family metal-binding transcriptional regulator